ncbi:Cytoplasmic dynein 1 intermediate chain 1, partial [Kappamyces sp. JEL0680]
TQANIAAPGTITPLKSFDSAQDYVADVAWSPTHPAVFASIDGSGNLDLYNLNENPDSMVSRLTVPHDRGLNKLAWSKSGETIALAALDGTVYLYEVGHLVASHPDDQSRFANTVRDFTENI